jgi:hypothetical protein
MQKRIGEVPWELLVVAAVVVQGKALMVVVLIPIERRGS